MCSVNTLQQRTTEAAHSAIDHERKPIHAHSELVSSNSSEILRDPHRFLGKTFLFFAFRRSPILDQAARSMLAVDETSGTAEQPRRKLFKPKRVRSCLTLSSGDR